MLWTKIVIGLGMTWAMLPSNAFADTKPAAAVIAPGVPEAVAPAAPGTPVAPQYAQIKPYRTFVTIQNYTMDNNGDAQNPISNVKIDVAFGKDQKMELPESGQYWPIGNGQKQDINRTYEVPWAAIANDGFAFEIQMVRKGSKMLPCQFKVNQLSQFNRVYVCHTDVQWQYDQKITEDKLDREGIEVRVFTDRNTPVKELPKDALALR